MDKVNYRAMIKRLYLKGLSAKQIINKLESIHGDSAPKEKYVYYWFTEFKCGRTNINDAPRSGRPNEATTPEIIKKVHKMVLNDCRVKACEISDILSICKNSATSVLHDYLHLKKLSSKWVPNSLTIDQKKERLSVSTSYLELYNRDPAEFLRRFITVDEIWLYYYIPNTKKNLQRKTKIVAPAEKVMATVFCDARGIIFIDYLEKGKATTGEHYALLLDRLKDEIIKKRPHLINEKIIIQQDDKAAHTSDIVKAKLVELDYELMPHSQCYPDLAPCDYVIFSEMEKWITGKKISSHDELILEVTAYLYGFERSYYADAIKYLEHRWTKCIQLEGDFVDET